MTDIDAILAKTAPKDLADDIEWLWELALPPEAKRHLIQRVSAMILAAMAEASAGYEPMREALKIAIAELEYHRRMIVNPVSITGALARIRELVPDMVTGSASSTEVKP